MACLWYQCISLTPLAAFLRLLAVNVAAGGGGVAAVPADDSGPWQCNLCHDNNGDTNNIVGCWRR